MQHHKVICIAHHLGVLSAGVGADDGRFHPVEGDIRQERRNHSPLWRSAWCFHKDVAKRNATGGSDFAAPGEITPPCGVPLGVSTKTSPSSAPACSQALTA